MESEQERIIDEVAASIANLEAAARAAIKACQDERDAATARADKAEKATTIRPVSQWTEDDGDVLWWDLEYHADGSLDADVLYWGSPLCTNAPLDEMRWWSYGPNFNQWCNAARKEAGL